MGLTPVFRNQFELDKSLLSDPGCSLGALLETQKGLFFFSSLPIFPTFFPNSHPLLPLSAHRRPAQLAAVRAVPGVREAGMSWLPHGGNSTYAPPRCPLCLRLHSNPGTHARVPASCQGQHLVLITPPKAGGCRASLMSRKTQLMVPDMRLGEHTANAPSSWQAKTGAAGFIYLFLVGRRGMGERRL